jgi:hypothetical protein
LGFQISAADEDEFANLVPPTDTGEGHKDFTNAIQRGDRVWLLDPEGEHSFLDRDSYY